MYNIQVLHFVIISECSLLCNQLQYICLWNLRNVYYFTRYLISSLRPLFDLVTSATKHTNLLVWERKNTHFLSNCFSGVIVLQRELPRAQRDEAASVWNQIQSGVMGSAWRGVLDALAEANGLAGSDRPDCPLCAARLKSLKVNCFWPLWCPTSSLTLTSLCDTDVWYLKL